MLGKKSLFAAFAAWGLGSSALAGEEFGLANLSEVMLPQGVGAVRLESRYGSARHKFDSSGERKPLADSLDGITVFNPLGPSYVGVTDISSEVSGVRERLILGYGLSADLTVGVMIPWATLRHQVRFDLAAPAPGATPDDVNTILGAVYGYKPIKSTTTSGLLDPVVGARWRAMRGSHDSLILSGGVRIGMTDPDDPASLVDLQLEDGTTDILAGLEYRRALGGNWDATFKYQRAWQLPDKVDARARAVGESLVPASRTERLDRDQGDTHEFMVELGYRMQDWRLLGRVERYVRGATDWDSPLGQDVSGLEQNSARRYTTLSAGFAWSSIDRFKQGDFPLPLVVEFIAQHMVEGVNAVQSTDYNLNLTVPFR